MVSIRKATPEDFEAAYKLGLDTSELRVSPEEDFMDPDEFRWSLTNPDGVFVVADDNGKIVGFSYACSDDLDKPFPNKNGWFAYMAVDKEYRGQGIASQMYEAQLVYLKKMGLKVMYVFANKSSSAIVSFFRKQNFNQGTEYIFFDKEI
jgi:ribosomal protein S18 acetylase RimI-like enzyme